MLAAAFARASIISAARHCHYRVIFFAVHCAGAREFFDGVDGNKTFDEDLEKFDEEAEAAGLVGTPGHRSVGGMRISLYNAVSPEAVQALTAFMREFQRTNG